jgi:SpoIIAA-like
MVETLADMPQGVVGLRASGKLTKEDYTGTLEPALKAAMDSGEARVIFVIEDYEGIEPSAAIEDIKTGLGVEVAHRKDWKRLAVVTDIDWMAKAMHAFAWAMPGELRVFGMDDLEEAKSWAAG